MIVLAIDPGLSGAMAIVAVGQAGKTTYLRPSLLAVGDIPTTGDGAKRRVDVLGVMTFIRQHPPDHAFVERAQAMPDQGASSGFIYGRAVGALEACVIGLLIPMTLAEPGVWKPAMKLTREKEDSRQRAIQLFPTAAAHLSRKKDHNRAEAALLAWYGLSQLRRTPVAAE